MSPILEYMKTTIDLPDKELADIMRYSGAKTKKEAITLAVSEYNRRHRLAKLASSIRGTFDTMIDQTELATLREDTPPYKTK